MAGKVQLEDMQEFEEKTLEKFRMNLVCPL